MKRVTIHEDITNEGQPSEAELRRLFTPNSLRPIKSSSWYRNQKLRNLEFVKVIEE